MNSRHRIAAVGACLLACTTPPAVTAASPNSAVTLYGIVDTGYQYVSNAPGGSLSGLSSGNLSGSRWGVRGTEDLGGGLQALFILESGIDVNTGHTLQGSRLFGRQALAGLAHREYGQLTLGRQNTLMIDWMSKYNPFDNANFSGKRVDPAFSDRMNSSVKYVGKFGGLSIGAHYSFGWNNEQFADDRKRGRMFALGARYAAGRLDAAGLFYRKHADAPRAGADSGNREDRALAGVSYRLGEATLFGGYRWLEQRLTTAEYRSHLYWVGIGYRTSPATRLSAAVYHLRGTVCDSLNHATCPAAQGAGSQQRPTMFVVGAEHDLSKRTTLYALGAYARNDNGSSLSVIGGNHGVNVEPGRNQAGVNVGIRHRF